VHATPVWQVNTPEYDRQMKHATHEDDEHGAEEHYHKENQFPQRASCRGTHALTSHHVTDIGIHHTCIVSKARAVAVTLTTIE